MAVNSGLPKRISYAAYNTNTQQFVSGDQANHTIELVLDGVVLGIPDNWPPTPRSNGVYEIALSEAERTGIDLTLNGASATADVIIPPMQYSADTRWNELLELDGGNLRGTTKYLEQAPVADVSNLALEQTLQGVKTVTDKLTFNGSNILIIDVQWWQGQNLSGTNMITDFATNPAWTTAALANTPAGAGGQDWTDTERNQIRNRLGVDGTSAVPTATPTLSLEASVQNVLTTGGTGPWTTANVSNLALEQTLQEVKSATDKFTFNTSNIPIVDVQWWQEGEISGVQMIEDLAGQPRWTIRALSNAPAGGGGGSVTFVNLPTEELDGFFKILRGDTLDYYETLGVDITTVTDIAIAIKESVGDADSDSLLYISIANGLEYINKEVATTSANGSVTKEHAAAGLIRIQCAAVEMAKLPERIRNSFMEIQLKTGDTIYTPWRKRVTIQGDVVRAV